MFLGIEVLQGVLETKIGILKKNREVLVFFFCSLLLEEENHFYLFIDLCDLVKFLYIYLCVKMERS